MPPVFCPCCNDYISRRQERVHRELLALSNTTEDAQNKQPNIPHSDHWTEKVLKEIQKDSCISINDSRGDGSADTHTTEQCPMNVDFIPNILTPLDNNTRNGMQEAILETEGQIYGAESEEDDASSVMSDETDYDNDGLGTCGDSDDMDWADFSDDMFGECFERDAQAVEEKLTEYDRAICRAFSYKLQSHITDRDFGKLPLAFPSNPPHPKLGEIRSRVRFLSEFRPERYDCCVKSCCAYTGMYSDLSACPYCSEPRYSGAGVARKKFTYIPIIPRLEAFVANKTTAREMQYRANEHTHSPGEFSDIFDGSHYRSLRNSKICIGSETLPTSFFSDDRDIALGLSTDGFSPFKRRKATAWPIILFNYNLPPDIRFHVDRIMALGVIPGPKKPINIDSFLRPMVVELLKLMQGVKAFDILSEKYFLLKAFLIVVFGDIPAVSMLMHMKGHNAISPCRMCGITGLRVPDSRTTTHYVPLDRSQHPDVIADSSDSMPKVFNASDLPLRTHDILLSQAREVQRSRTITAATALSKKYGIKGVSILSQISSLKFPTSFPYDFMHLIWENLIPNLVLHWTGQFKGLDDGSETYEIEKTCWDAIGEATLRAGDTIPSAYGPRVPNISQDSSAYVSAEMWSFWTLYLAPALLRGRFREKRYYEHFICLVRLLNICLQFSISESEINDVEFGFRDWVSDYERFYYQKEPARLATCPVTIHALLHISDGMRAMGPVWCYWAFPMERFCGKLQPAIRSRRFPYASLDRFVVEDAQLTQIKAMYDVAEELSLQPVSSALAGYMHPSYPSYSLLLPSLTKIPPENTIGVLAAALVTRASRNPPVEDIETDPSDSTGASRLQLKKANISHLHISRAKKLIKEEAQITEWGRLKQIDSDEGDTMCSSSLVRQSDDRRDASFVKYELLVDKFMRKRKRQPEYEVKTFYGEIEHLYAIKFSDRKLLEELYLVQDTVILAAIRPCVLDSQNAPRGLDIRYYSRMGALDVVDVVTIQCLVGRVPLSNNRWAIIDRSGSLARALQIDNET